MVNHPSQKFFPCSGFSGQEDGRLRILCRLGHPCEKLFHGDAVRDEFGQAVVTGVMLGRKRDPSAQEEILQGPVNDRLYASEVHGLDEEIIGPQLHGFDRIFDRSIGGQDDHRRVSRFRAQCFQCFDSCHSWHLEVEEDQVRDVLLDGGEQRISRFEGPDSMLASGQAFHNRIAKGGLIICDEDTGLHRRYSLWLETGDKSY